MTEESIEEKTTRELPVHSSSISGRLRPRDRASYVLQAVTSIMRNKRRSVSMIAGLILGISILAGISLYSNVLMTNVYFSIIEGEPYEIRMDFKKPLTDEELTQYITKFKDDPLISDVQILYGDARTITETTGTSSTIYTKAYLAASIQVQYNNENFTGSYGRVFTEEFYDSDIGRNIRKKLITGNEPEIYTNTSPNYLGIIISESLAEKAKLQQGNKLRTLTLEIEDIDPNDPDSFFGGGKVIETVHLANITIAGIMSSETEASAGLFTGAIEGFGGGEIFLPIELFNHNRHGGNQTKFLARLEENEMRYLAIKINEDEFNLADPPGVSREINSLINLYEIDDPTMLVGSNLVENKLLPFQIMSIMIYFFDALLTIPVAILSIYLLSFGIDLSLHERRYQVGILKTQGASPSQIKRKILMEALLLAAIGLVLGYIIAVFGAWIIGTATGFMSWGDAPLPISETALEELPDFLKLMPVIGNIDQTAFLIIGGLIVLILIFMVNGKANKFIRMEVAETIRRADEIDKQNFLRRNGLDIIFFLIGLTTLLLVFIAESGVSLEILGPGVMILALLGPFLFWIGGAAVVARVAVWIPSKTDPIIKRIGFLKDVSILVKGNIFRKSGDFPRLALIIALTVSFSILASVQGNTGETHQRRTIEFGVGSDMVITTTPSISSTIIPKVKESSASIENVMALNSISGMFTSDSISIYSIDSSLYGQVGIWQSDSIPGGGNKDTILNQLKNNPTGCLIGKRLFSENHLKLNQVIPVEILTFYWNGTLPQNVNASYIANLTDFSRINLVEMGIFYDFIKQNLTIQGIFDHTPGGIGSNAIIIDHSLLNSLTNMSFFSGLDPKGVLTSKYLVQTSKEAKVTNIADKLLENKWVTKVRTFKGELLKANEIEQMDFGIPGLLTADFIISLLAATLATFIFMSILMEKRKKEFAILRSYGASRGQVYKVVFSESIVLLLTSVIWGLFIGLGLSIMFNGFFEFLGVFITPLTVLEGGGYQIDRILIFDWPNLLLTVSITFLAMLFATFLSVRGASTAKISTVVREL